VHSARLDHYVEQICQRGCKAVSRDIRLLEQGGVPAGIEALAQDERTALLVELKSVMAVYGERCPLD